MNFFDKLENNAMNFVQFLCYDNLYFFSLQKEINRWLFEPLPWYPSITMFTYYCVCVSAANDDLNLTFS